METVTPNYIPGTDVIFVQRVDKDGEITDEGDIVLVPQPSVSPNDPLNWSKIRKYTQLIMILLFTGLTAATSNACGAAQDGIQEANPSISDNIFNAADGVLFLGVAWFTLLAAPSVYLYGSRIGYLTCIVLGIIGGAWYANCRTGGDVIGAQLFIGASESVSEAVTQLSITQVFFQHQANNYIGLYVLTISVGTFLGPLIGAIIADNLNWNWVGYMSVICVGFVGILLFFFLEETYFDRSQHILKYSDSHEHLKNQQLQNDRHSMSGESSDGKIKESKNGCLQAVVPCNEENFGMDNEVDDPPKSYLKRIALITPATNLKGTGFKQYMKRLVLLLQVLTFPPVIYSGLQWGAQDAWLSFYMDLEETYYYDPPYNYSDTGVGLMNIPCLIGATIGCLYGSWFSDWFVLWIAKRNGGVREAETRLWCLLPAGLISPAGMFLLGIGTERHWAWYAPYVGLGMIGFGWGCCGDLSMSYLVDCYPEMVLEGMVGVSLINNNLAMVFSFVVDYWLSIGPENTFISVGVLNFFIIFLSLPMIYFGKTCRIWSADRYRNYVKVRDSLNSH